MFTLSLVLLICASLMLYGAITANSPIKTFTITIMGIILIGCSSLVREAYKELKEE